MSHLILLPTGADLVDDFARDLVRRHRDRLPDLSTTDVVVPSPSVVTPLRRRLAHHAGRGLLGPRITTLAGFAAQHAAGRPALSPLECRLLLTEALRRHRGLFAGQDNARVAEALFELFEELTLHAVDPGADEAGFRDRLGAAYGPAPREWLSREAQIVHRLWLAFREDCGDRSPAACHLRDLRRALAAGTGTVHLLGIDELARGELALVATALQAGRAELWLSGRRHGHDGVATAALVSALGVEPEPGTAPASPLRALLDASFRREATGADASVAEERAPHSMAHEEPVDQGVRPLFRLVEAGSAEHEARCVDLAVREALLAGRRDVVVLTQDRRLARRLRALLERAGVELQDHGGWALSTSRAAAALDAWLECIEGRFRFRPLLALLKSGFADVDAHALEQLERHLIYQQGIEGGLDEWLGSTGSPALKGLLRRLKAASFAPPHRGEARPAGRWSGALLRSLGDIGLAERLQRDEAGLQLWRLLGHLDAAFARVPLALAWDEFRDLLDEAVERETFAPQAARGGVRLLTLEQAGVVRCDVLILAGASREQLPGAPGRDPFFSQPVRAELGLPDWQARQALALSRLRRALEGAAEVVVTWAPGADDEPAQASPWIEAIEAQAASGHLDLRDRELPRRALAAACEVGAAEAGPADRHDRPAPATPAELLPQRLSATAHQALVDCPYRFFARSLLKLKAEHAPDEDPDRSDYGKRVHAILQAFTVPVEGMPAPFTERISAATRQRAQARLDEIARAVFARDLATRALALTWLAEFRASIPAIVDWMSRRPPLRRVQVEIDLTRDLDGTRLHGILDRLETRADGSTVIVDYKAGRVPKEEDVRAGEQVQLLHYALLDPGAAVAEYTPLREKYDPVVLEEGLPALREAAGERLRHALARLRAAAPLPAQGDAAVCGHCDYGGLCRREDWTPAEPGGAGD